MEKDYLNRMRIYGWYAYVNQIKKGVKHKDLSLVVIIVIIRNKSFARLIAVFSYDHIKESKTHKQYLFSLAYVFIESEKFKKMILKIWY